MGIRRLVGAPDPAPTGGSESRGTSARTIPDSSRASGCGGQRDRLDGHDCLLDSGAAVSVVLLLLITCTATPPHPEPPLPESIQITALPTTRAERPAVLVITPEPGTSAPDPKFFLIVTVVDAALYPLPAMITLEFPATGVVREVGPAPRQLFPIPIDGEEYFIVRASAEGYQPVQQEFRVSLTTDADYELVLVLQPALTHHRVYRYIEGDHQNAADAL